MNTQKLTLGGIFLFWAPLAATWLMMSLEGPFLSAVIARMAEPTFNLAAYGVAFSLALLIEAPIIMVMSASTALVRDYRSYRTLKRFVFTLCGAVSLIMAGITLQPVFDVLAVRLIGLTEDVAELTWLVCLVMIPWPGVIGYRRFYQGVLIRNNRTRFVAYGTVIRLTAMASTAGLAVGLSDLPGAVVGGMALTTGVTAEALASRMMAAGAIRRLAAAENSAHWTLTYTGITKFYLPLALTTVLALGVRPLVTFFLGKSRLALESLAVFPVVHALAFLFICLGISYQEAVIALVGEEHQNYRPLRQFAILLMLFSGGGLGLIAFTPLSGLWFQEVSGLSSELTALAGQPMMILWLLPALWVAVSFQRAILVDAARTGPITTGTVLQVLTIALVLMVTIQAMNLAGIMAAAMALLAGSLVGCLYLFPKFLQVRRTQDARLLARAHS